MPRWQAAQRMGVSEETLRRWETGETRPEPDDVWTMEHVYNAPGLWHRWMRSTYDSYRDNWPEVPQGGSLPMAVVNARHQMADVMAIQDAAERDAMDGRMDNQSLRAHYMRETREALAALTEALRRMEET